MPPKKATPKLAAKVSPKVAAKVSLKVAAKATPKLAAKVSPKVAAKVSPKVAAKVSLKVAAKVSPKLAAKVSPKASKATSKPAAMKAAMKVSAVPAPAPAPASTPAAITKSVSEKFIKKGKGVVDPYFAKASTCRVVEDDGLVWQCTLNQTNVGSNNNKFYVIQLLKDEVSPLFYVFTRWGRVGVPGQQATEPVSNLILAKSAFRAKFRAKTCNDFATPNFKKFAGKYQLMDIDYGSDDDADADTEGDDEQARKKPKTEAPAPPKSKLPREVQELIPMISSLSAMSNTLRELEIDTRRMPLGKISKGQIKSAYGALQKIEKELKKKSPNVEAATSEFYTLIPHDFGFRRPPLINTVMMLKEKIEMLDTLSQLEVSSNLLSQESPSEENPIDKTYSALECELQPLARTDAEFQLVEEYARNTAGSTHTAYTLSVDTVFRVHRKGEHERYESHSKSIDNKQMLWHGSRTTNYVGILSQGLRIAPKEAPCTGYMFGKGIYLADTCTKSANYCCTSRMNNTGLMLLCEAALGKQKEYTSSCYMEKAQPGFDSTKGVGRMHPNPKEATTVDGVLWPKGRMMEDKATNLSLLYPEYIVYDVAQVRMRYLIKMRFDYKR
ncbi:putative poly(ADP-ribose) polymerase [Leptomonas seymouri]|uniref:Poly [ADP-ribose] polymerase n=1 Tax=Leptomonas seymouri TaxID=5684 RepID=A0A0N0P5H7_LEPSE|nr:putative poly(ADP-ribose) polymerase [Leptomonas seymouri]|eukprot:KPI86479.1 putative poly(ADP-ribose) polymerase [Leptomonas seymouri]